MITGVAIGRGARLLRSEGHQRGVQAEIGAGLSSLANTSLAVDNSAERASSNSGRVASDFVWAVRLAKISKGILEKSWKYETFSKGATYGSAEEPLRENLLRNLRVEGVPEICIVEADGDDEIFVI
ncbi:hypothetical protein Cob_v010828 [Colletotrichum orbiculare MAFF 240422]|uniref:Uncharacterized protein n=1 Tax=Colletotrichum orbiculare (strain 104-T / ATCC 96160 / CBS 514.97 / LARS 414 / MAFF 240422) TaxID=1213857 RepID=A0A484FD19_COLOR|nr:hypothetical protein Cob_v010828 [Colletotrichum orbiculare MAFF 240422]